MEILESESNSGTRNSKKYKWKLKEAPSKALVESLYEKIKEYNRKYAPSKKEETVLNSVPATKLELQPFQPNENNSLKSTIAQMKIKRDAKLELTEALLIEVNDLNLKIKEGEDILSLKEKEKKYLESCSTFIADGKLPLELKPVYPELKAKRSNGDKAEIIIKCLTNCGPTSLKDLYKLFHPTKEFSWDKDAQTLSSLIHYMKKRGKIEDDQRKATYKIKA